MLLLLRGHYSTQTAVVSSLGFQKEAMHTAGIGIHNDYKVKNIICDKHQPVQAVENIITYLPKAIVQAVENVITERGYYNLCQAVLTSLYSNPPISPSTTYNLYLDGKSIKNKVSSIKVNYSESSVHNAITFASNDMGLYLQCDPRTNRGTSRITLEVGNRTLYFLVEKRAYSDIGFTTWGRSLTALDDFPYASETSYSSNGYDLASYVAGVVAERGISWTAHNWTLHSEYSFKGRPIEAVTGLADIIGAVARSNDSGNFVVRKKYPTRPIDMVSASPTLRLTEDKIISGISVEEQKGTGQKYITVYGKEADTVVPDIEILNSQLIYKRPVWLKTYWEGILPPQTLHYVTNGQISDRGMFLEHRDERIYFLNGKARTKYPIANIRYLEYISPNYGVVISGYSYHYPKNTNYTKYTKEITATHNHALSYAIADVSYTTKYRKYKITPPALPEIIAIIMGYAEDSVAATIRRGSGSGTATPLRDSNITSIATASVAGRAWMDANVYDTIIYSFTTPYNNSLIDGVTINVNDYRLNFSGNCHVATANIQIEGPKIINEVEAIRFLT